jgi:hypothetical protein
MSDINEVVITGSLFKKVPIRKFEKLTVGGGLLSVKNGKVNNYIGFKAFNELAQVIEDLELGDEVSCTGYLKTETFNNQYKLVLILKTISIKEVQDLEKTGFDPEF